LKFEVVKHQKTFTFTLTEEEARTLLTVCYRIGGDPHRSRRLHMDNIRKAFKDDLALLVDLQSIERGEIYFKETL
jgi:hypothetical protein